MGVRKPDPLKQKSSRENVYVNIFGEYFTRCAFSRQWQLRQTAAAVVEILIDGDVEFLKAFIKYHRLDPAGFFYLLSEFLSELLDDRVAKVFEQISVSVECLFSILWQDEQHQRKRRRLLFG